jgi:hypothetical protein
LPNVLSGAEIGEKGLNLSQFQMRLLEKVEELTLYIVNQAKTMGLKEAEIAALKAQNANLDSRLAELERMMGRLLKREEGK